MVASSPSAPLLFFLIWMGTTVHAAFLPRHRPFTWGALTPNHPLPSSPFLERPLTRRILTASSWDAPEDQDEDDEEESKSSNWREWLNPKQPPSQGQQPVQPVHLDGTPYQPIGNESSLRVTSNLNKFFKGMPTIKEMIQEPPTEPSTPETKKKTQKPQEEEAWFWEERQRIEAKYQQLWRESEGQLKLQQDQGVELPKNAKGVLKAILQQEMEQELAAAREQLAQTRLQQYESNARRDYETNQVHVNAPVLDKLMQDSEAEWELQQALQAQVQDYETYQQAAWNKLQQEEEDTPNVQDDDLDAWALKQLEGMLQDSQRRDDEAVADILEDNIQDLRVRLEKEKKKGTIQPETLKEWQMYRSIASRRKDTEDEVKDDEILSQLESWKDFQVKEEQYRKQSGLSRGPDMPFWWQEAGKDPLGDLEEETVDVADQRTRNEIRRQVNRQAVQALESLLEKTSDPARAENLQRELAFLKQELEPRGYLDVEETEPPEETVKPVDLTGVFESRGTKVEGPSTPLPPPVVARNAPTTADKDPNPPPFPYPPAKSETDVPATTPPASDDTPTVPQTPFFDSSKDEITQERPNTPFFQETSDDDDDDDDDDGDDENVQAAVGSKLGSGEEQKLRNMYRRAGARTPEEQEAIRLQWEEFQKFEKARRDESGLSDESGRDLPNEMSLKYDVSEVMKGDGDFDAEKILATIGPRPTRNKSGKATSPARDPKPSTDTSASDNAGQQNESPSETTLGDESLDTSPQTNLDPSEVSDSLYRAVAAVGGGRHKDDPDAKAQEKAAFDEFMTRENEMRRNLDSLEQDTQQQAVGDGESFDDEKYAQDALSSLGPRPSPRKVQRIVDEAEYSDRGGVLADYDGQDGDDDEDLDEEVDSLDDDDTDDTPTLDGGDNLIPEWLRKEREEKEASLWREGSSSRSQFPGSKIDEVFDDEDYEKNMRQLAEYERRRSGRKKQMGIDISDIFGQSYDTDDHVHYTYDDYYSGEQSWGASSFEARKADLLEYTELNMIDVNSLMDHKDSVFSTGVSPYTPRINKPFKEFGAIFRLEGVLMDVTGIQFKAWKHVAEKFGFRKPELEDVKRAAVTRPDLAVRDVFGWTDDRIRTMEAISSHRQALKDLFEEWARDSGFSPAIETPSQQEPKGVAESFLGLPADDPPVLPSNEEERFQLMTKAWRQTAEEYGLRIPESEEIFSASSLSPDLAVMRVFGWTKDVNEAGKVGASYQRHLRGTSNGSVENVNMPAASTPSANDSARSEQSVALDEAALLELQYMAWTKVAEQNGLEPPTPDEVVAAVVLNDPEVVIRDGFGWTQDSSVLRDYLQLYRDVLSQLTSERYRSPKDSAAPTSQPEATIEQLHEGDQRAEQAGNNRAGPTEEELLDVQVYSWTMTAERHGFDAPTLDLVQLAMNMDPKEAISRVLRWSTDQNEIATIKATYERTLKNISEKYIQKYGLKAPDKEEPTVAPFDGVAPSSDDLYKSALQAWTAVATDLAFEPPDEEQVLFAMTVGPEEAVVTGFGWSQVEDDVAEIVKRYKEKIETVRAKWKHARVVSSHEHAAQEQKGEEKDDIPLFAVMPGAAKWVKSLLDVEMQCGIVSYFERDQVDLLLEHAGLSSLIPRDKRVSANNGYSRDSQQLLGAALRLERRPDHCAVFDSSPYSSAAAREVEMKSVSIIGPYPRYELLSADTATASFEELSAMNIRRLFGERIYDQPMLDMQQTQPDVRRKTKTAFYWDDD